MLLIRDIAKEFKFDSEVRKLSRRTIKSYVNSTNLFFEYIEREFNIIHLEEITHLHIKQYFKILTDKKLTESYLNGILKCIRAFFVYCKKEEYIATSPALKVPWQKEPKVLIKTFTDEEVMRMVDVFKYANYLSTRNKAIMAILFDTGIRNLELCFLRNQDIKDMHILVQGKGNKERYVAKSPLLQKYLIKYERVKEGYFRDKTIKDISYFLSRNGRQLTVEAVERIVRRCGEMAGVRSDIRCSPHTCRHFFAQSQLKSGLDVYSLSRLLGHEDISITKRYLQSMQDDDIVEKSTLTSPLMNLGKRRAER